MTTSPTPASAANSEALKWLLKIIESAGGDVDSSDGPNHPLNVFCNDNGDGEDTFNRAESLGLIWTTHDTSFDTSRTRLTDAGRAYLALQPHPSQQAGDPVRHHLTEPTVQINGEWLGKGWLLITEEEYAQLRTTSQQAGTGVSEAMVTAGLISWFGREKMSADAAYVRANWGKPMRFAIQAALNTSEAWGFHTGETKGDGA